MKMEAKNLRIGNIILVDGVPTEIGLTGIESILMQEKGASNHFGYHIKFEPILLNGHWLTKFGYEFEDGEGNYGIFKKTHRNVTIIVDGSGYYWYDRFGNGIKVDYVHQLQNLFFSVTRMELILK